MLEAVLLTIGFYGAFGVFELAFPAQRGQSLRGKIRNIAFGTIVFAVGGGAVTGLYLLIPHPPPLPDRGVLVSIVITVLYVFCTDFIFYWYHRAQHRFKRFWLVHELHHSETELNVTTSMRTYWLERPLQALLITIPVGYIIGVDHTAVVLLPIVLIGWLCFTHANLRLQLGPLTPVICGPQLHRIHHSITPYRQTKNFAQFFPIIDILFGTYRAPVRDEFPETGTDSLAGHAPFVSVLARPFTTRT